MAEIDGVLFCDGCGVEIIGAPIVRDNQIYCCETCAEGLPCDCGLIFDDERRQSNNSDAAFQPNS